MVSRSAPPTYLQLWYEALASDLGIVISTNNPEALRQVLYKARRESGDPALEGMSVRISPLLPDQEVWILRDDKKSRRTA